MCSLLRSSTAEGPTNLASPSSAGVRDGRWIARVHALCLSSCNISGDASPGQHTAMSSSGCGLGSDACRRPQQRNDSYFTCRQALLSEYYLYLGILSGVA